MRNLAVRTLDMILLAVLFVSLLAVYASRPESMPLLIAGAIMLICIFLALSGPPWVTGVLGGVTLLFGGWAIILFAASRPEDNGWLAGALLVCIAVVFVGYLLFAKNAMYSRDGIVKVVFDEFDNPIHYVYSGRAFALPPMTRTVSIAEIPIYEQTTLVEVKDINLPARHNVKRIAVRVVYDIPRVTQLFTAFPNRSGAWESVAKEMKQPLSDARKSPVFWEQLFSNQMRAEIESHLRDIIHYEERYKDKTEADGTVIREIRPLHAQDLYGERGKIAEQLRQRVGASVQRWGARIKEGAIIIETVEVDPDVSKRIGYDPEKEVREAKQKALVESASLTGLGEARAEFQAQFIAKLIAAFQDHNIPIDPNDIKQIVLQSMQEATSQRYRTDELLKSMLIGAGVPQENRKN